MTSFVRLLRVLLGAVFALCLLCSVAADVHIKGYTRKDGTYVPPNTRSSPNKTKNDNYPTRGNINACTGHASRKPSDTPTGLPIEPFADVERIL